MGATYDALAADFGGKVPGARPEHAADSIGLFDVYVPSLKTIKDLATSIAAHNAQQQQYQQQGEDTSVLSTFTFVDELGANGAYEGPDVGFVLDANAGSCLVSVVHAPPRSCIAVDRAFICLYAYMLGYMLGVAASSVRRCR
jgi:hypothetical protein